MNGNEPCDHTNVVNADQYDICENCNQRWLANINEYEHESETEE